MAAATIQRSSRLNNPLCRHKASANMTDSKRMGLSRKLYYTLHSGKNVKAFYYIRQYGRMMMPRELLIPRLDKEIARLLKHYDEAQIHRRVDYYCKLTEGSFDPQAFAQRAVTLAHQPVTSQKVYYLDSMEYARWFPQTLRWVLLQGDINYAADVPSIVKSRPINGHNECSVLLNLNKVRHFTFVKDRKQFAEKRDMAIFRGFIGQDNARIHDLKQNRYDFVARYFNTPYCDAGVIDNGFPAWKTAPLTIAEHFNYKFVMALEGNDVASNLKWIMYSNSVAVMPRPTCESWFMEGTLIPNYHYIEIKPDFSDFEEKIAYYATHIRETEEIVENAHEYVRQFMDKRREKLISLLVLKKYFELTNR